jgi:hypothetical protein
LQDFPRLDKLVYRMTDEQETAWHNHQVAHELLELSKAEFYYYYGGLNALNSIGLDIHGGLVDLKASCAEGCRAKRKDKLKAILNTTTYVTDPGIARKFINIGVHLGTDILMHPCTLAEAADAYARISALVTEEYSREDFDKVSRTSRSLVLSGSSSVSDSGSRLESAIVRYCWTWRARSGWTSR